MKFSITEIKSAWEQYKIEQMKEVLVKGEKVYIDMNAPMPQGATSAQVVPMRKAMGFPEYLETRCIRK
jgi:predicted HAD superfamily phosphohydrolase YqeG